ncbi:MAG TPA: hypothetical protein VGM98_15275 [Schlesneria sp.]|jgi:hypothetical protein
MLWWLAGIVTIAFVVEWFIVRGHVTFGRWAFTARSNGSFSKWQMASQMTLIAILAIGAIAFLLGMARR